MQWRKKDLRYLGYWEAVLIYFFTYKSCTRQMMIMFCKTFCQHPRESTLDPYRRYLTAAGYLASTDKPGIYKVLKKPYRNITIAQVRREAYG